MARKQITINTAYNGSQNMSAYTLDIDPEDLGALAVGILTHLGCSYEIRWPREQEDSERREREWAQIAENLRHDAEAYASAHTPFDNEIEREIVEERLAEAYRNGWLNAPKGVRYTYRSRGKWTP